MEPQDVAERMKVPFSMAIASKRDSGKTVFVEQLTQAFIDLKKIDYAIVFSGTVEYNDDYQSIPKGLRRGWSEEALARLIQHQKDKPKYERKRILVILDDLLGEDGAQRSPSVMFLYSKGRHLNFSVILSSQQANLVLTPLNRNNSDWIFISRLSQSQSETLWECVAGIEKKDFVQMVDKLSKDYHFIAIDRKSNSTDVTEYMHVVCSRPPKKSFSNEYNKDESHTPDGR
jgi:hypothetical protein